MILVRDFTNRTVTRLLVSDHQITKAKFLTRGEVNKRVQPGYEFSFLFFFVLHFPSHDQ